MDDDAPIKGRYRKIEVRTWSDAGFRSLSPMPPSGQGLWFFLLTGPHTGPIPGLFRGGRAAMAEELGWEQEAFDKAFQELSDKGMVEADREARLMWLPNALKHNRPESPNVIKSWRAEFDLLPECDLKTQALSSMGAVIKTMGPAFQKALKEAFPKAFGKGYVESGAGAGAGTGAEEDGYTREFEEAWSAYPSRPGANKKTAFGKWKARLSEGCKAEDMIAGVKRYKAFCLASRTEPQFIKQPETFFGPAHHFALAWELPAGKTPGSGKPSSHSLAGKDYKAGVGADGALA